MTTFIYIDSNNRAPEDTVANFKIPCSATKSWISQPRSVSITPPSLTNQLLDYKSTLTADEFIVEYTWPTATPETPAPFIKINFYNLEYNEPQLINSMYDTEIFTKFIATRHRTLSTEIVGLDTKTWVLYRSKMIQVLRIKRVGDFYLETRDQDSNPLNCTRIVAVFGILPVLSSSKFTKLNIPVRN